ncbi:hypothetical protein EF914_25160 [Streptomyces sp. WAC05458]|uniref:Uncharacterized protein n=1 Tax=Streptomyces rochei TaxID=1928 RepID=A0ABW7E938_STRRO|nr:hypothetical protein [Streptomyces sp. WAC05458]RSS17513.1 hypothetical protein EF914_25160 [Streptomyces sp. WAC05458]
MKRRVRRTVASLAVAAIMSALGIVSTASPAAAAPQVSFGSPGIRADGSRYISVAIDGAAAGWVLWAADPDSSEWSSTGDTLLVKDNRTDGMSINGTVVHASGTSSYYRYASTSGLKAPALVRKSGNLAEERKLQLRPCVYKGSAMIACGPYYSIHA